MSETGRTRRFLIVAGDADGNLGDRAILQAVCQELRSIEPGAHISAVGSRRSAGNADIHMIPRGPKGFTLLLATAARADVVICGGGGLFQDDDSLVKMPYWAIRLLLLRLCCRHVVGYSLGVGPLSAPTSRWSASLAFRLMQLVTVRDPIAQNTAQALTEKPVEVVPDPASVLRPVPAESATTWLEEQGVPLDGRPLIGIAVRRWFPPKPRLIPNKLAARFRSKSSATDELSEAMCSLMANVLDQLVANRGAYVLFMPTYNVPHEGDDLLCRNILEKMESASGKILHIDDASLYMGVCSRLLILIGGRMHPTLLANAVGTPVVGLAYNPKFHGAFSLQGIGQHVMDISAFVTQGLKDELLTLVETSIERTSELDSQVESTRTQLRLLNERILELVA